MCSHSVSTTGFSNNEYTSEENISGCKWMFVEIELFNIPVN